MDALARAYATLELAANASAADLKKRYRLLVKRWHPDQWSGDAQGQAEAAVRMREIHDAYRRISVHLAGHRPATMDPSATASRAAGPDHAPPGHRLSREEIDRIVASLGTEGPLDWLLRPFGSKKRARESGMIGLQEFNRRTKIAAGLTGITTVVICLIASANGVDPLSGPAFLLNTAAISFAVFTRMLSLWEP